MAVRITQIVPETVIEPSTGKVRVTQIVPETVMLPSTGEVRITQLVVETVYFKTLALLQQPNICVIC